MVKSNIQKYIIFEVNFKSCKLILNVIRIDKIVKSKVEIGGVIYIDIKELVKRGDNFVFVYFRCLCFVFVVLYIEQRMFVYGGGIIFLD